jgi:hypothetical protein
MRCPHCSVTVDPNNVSALGPLAGEHGGLKLSLEGIPAVKCPKGHCAPVNGDFMFWLMQELKGEAGKIPGGEEKGLLMKKFLCGCGKELPAKSDARKAFSASLSFEGKYAIKAILDAAVVKCPGCGKEQARSAKETVRDVPHAMADVTDAAGFPHGQ